MHTDHPARPRLKRLPTGVPGLDTILRGGFLRDGTFIIQGSPCKRNIEMTPLCKVKMALPRVPGSRKMHQLRPETADRKEGKSPLLPPLYFVT